jgi:hypothetical protein
MKMSNTISRRLHRSLIVFPALALVVTVGCVSSSGAAPSPDAKKTTTTLKKKKVVTATTIAKGAVMSGNYDCAKRIQDRVLTFVV